MCLEMLLSLASGENSNIPMLLSLLYLLVRLVRQFDINLIELTRKKSLVRPIEVSDFC